MTAQPGSSSRTGCRPRPFPGSWCKRIITILWFPLTVAAFTFWKISRRSNNSETGAEASVAPLRSRVATYRLLRGGRALLNYSLKEPAKDAIKLEILDAHGNVIREMKESKGQAGLNRVSWDLHYEKPKLVELRTTPPQNPHIWEEPRFEKTQTRPITHWGLEPAEVGPIAAPGKYTARLTVDGQSYSQPLEVLRPPISHGVGCGSRSVGEIAVESPRRYQRCRGDGEPD